MKASDEGPSQKRTGQDGCVCIQHSTRSISEAGSDATRLGVLEKSTPSGDGGTGRENPDQSPKLSRICFGIGWLSLLFWRRAARSLTNKMESSADQCLQDGNDGVRAFAEISFPEFKGLAIPRIEVLEGTDC